MKLPARVIAVALWILAVAVTIDEWLKAQATIMINPKTREAEFVFNHLNNVLTHFALSNVLKDFVYLLALGAIVWLLGEIRDRLPKQA